MANTTTITVRVAASVKKRLEGLAKKTGRSRSMLAAAAIADYVAVQEWQIAGVKAAMASLDKGNGVPHARVKDWIESWGTPSERPMPRRS